MAKKLYTQKEFDEAVDKAINEYVEKHKLFSMQDVIDAIHLAEKRASVGKKQIGILNSPLLKSE